MRWGGGGDFDLEYWVLQVENMLGQGALWKEIDQTIFAKLIWINLPNFSIKKFLPHEKSMCIVFLINLYQKFVSSIKNLQSGGCKVSSTKF